jgi:hypothetical protein
MILLTKFFNTASQKVRVMPMKKHNIKVSLTLVYALVLVLFTQCSETKKKHIETATLPEANVPLKKAPDFNADSSFAMVAKQVNYGYRIPNTQPHIACGNYLVATLKKFNWEVTEQPFEEQNYKGEKMRMRNIIGSYNPKATKRILLAAHWDSRHIADNDKVNKDKPIDGANDGASGVAVLLEIARVINESKEKPNVGIDIIFFDGEDHGDPEGHQFVGPMNTQENQEKTWWCLGSQYWSKNKHIEGYTAYYGILLDMVGNKNAKFAKEGQSMQFAPAVVDKVWTVANKLGYTNFTDVIAPSITDDHDFVNIIARINMIDIIEYDNSDGIYFSNTWHTHQDNIENIDKETLKKVGQTVLTTIWQE